MTANRPINAIRGKGRVGSGKPKKRGNTVNGPT